MSLAACGGEKADESSAPAAESSDPVAESSAPGGEESSEPEVSTPWEDIAPAESFTLDHSVYKSIFFCFIIIIYKCIHLRFYTVI